MPTREPKRKIRKQETSSELPIIHFFFIFNFNSFLFFGCSVASCAFSELNHNDVRKNGLRREKVSKNKKNYFIFFSTQSLYTFTFTLYLSFSLCESQSNRHAFKLFKIVHNPLSYIERLQHVRCIINSIFASMGAINPLFGSYVSCIQRVLGNNG